MVTAVDGVPGEQDRFFATGNLVVLRQVGEVYSAYAHPVPGSLKVKVGDRVRRGQLLGACGNSGNSSEPHLHVQFQDGPRFEASWGREAVFSEAQVVRDGVSARLVDYTFRKGDRVAPSTNKGGRSGRSANLCFSAATGRIVRRRSRSEPCLISQRW